MCVHVHACTNAMCITPGLFYLHRSGYDDRDYIVHVFVCVHVYMDKFKPATKYTDPFHLASAM